MRAYCFFEPLRVFLDPVNEVKLIHIWADNWHRHGWEPVVIGEFHAAKHRDYASFKQCVAKLPSVNPPGYDLNCYLRWLAVAQMLGKEIGVMADYDAMANGLTPERAMEFYSPEYFSCLQGNVPCVVVGNGGQFYDQCLRFLDPVIDVNHWSDMHNLDRQRKEQEMDPAITTFRVLDIVKSYGEPGWEKALGIHFASDALKPHNLTPKWQHIPKLMEACRA